MGKEENNYTKHTVFVMDRNTKNTHFIQNVYIYIYKKGHYNDYISQFGEISNSIMIWGWAV